MITLDFVRVTENAALAASRWTGRGERDLADGAAVERMRIEQVREAGARIKLISDGITDGDLAQGVRFFGNRARTHSVVMDLQGTLREIDSVHRLRAVPR